MEWMIWHKKWEKKKWEYLEMSIIKLRYIWKMDNKDKYDVFRYE